MGSFLIRALLVALWTLIMPVLAFWPLMMVGLQVESCRYQDDFSACENFWHSMFGVVLFAVCLLWLCVTLVICLKEVD